MDTAEKARASKTIGENMIEMASEAGCYLTKLHGQTCLSIKAGLFLQNLKVKCLVSIEKLPELIIEVIAIIWDKQAQSTIDYIVRSSHTIQRGIDRSLFCHGTLLQSQLTSTDPNALTTNLLYLISHAAYWYRK